jgi:queuine tRNA-ribosyltransferase
MPSPLLSSSSSSSSAAAGLSFKILEEGAGVGAGGRLGCLAMPGRRPIYTPHYIATTSRGVVPHLAPDMLRQHTRVNAVYVALEDCKLQYSMIFFSGLVPCLAPPPSPLPRHLASPAQSSLLALSSMFPPPLAGYRIRQ